MNNKDHFNMVCNYYTQNASRIDMKYNQTTFDEIHGNWFWRINPSPGFALDVGAGSGRDAIGLAKNGWSVVALEPSEGLYNVGKKKSEYYDIQWFNEGIPEMFFSNQYTYIFHLILISGVWMHIPPEDREESFRKLSELLSSSGMMVFKIRYGPSTYDELFFDVNKDEILDFALKYKHVPIFINKGESDTRKRNHVSWETIILR